MHIGRLPDKITGPVAELEFDLHRCRQINGFLRVVIRLKNGLPAALLRGVQLMPQVVDAFLSLLHRVSGIRDYLLLLMLVLGVSQRMLRRAKLLLSGFIIAFDFQPGRVLLLVRARPVFRFRSLKIRRLDYAMFQNLADEREIRRLSLLSLRRITHHRDRYPGGIESAGYRVRKLIGETVAVAP